MGAADQDLPRQEVRSVAGAVSAPGEIAAVQGTVW